MFINYWIRYFFLYLKKNQLPSDTITLDPNVIGTIDKTNKAVLIKERIQEKLETEQRKLRNMKKKKKQKGRSTADKAVLDRETKRDQDKRDRIR